MHTFPGLEQRPRWCGGHQCEDRPATAIVTKLCELEVNQAGVYLAFEDEVELGMLGERFNHVIQKANASFHVGLPSAIQINVNL